MDAVPSPGLRGGVRGFRVVNSRGDGHGQSRLSAGRAGPCFVSVSSVPEREVGLVLGTSKSTRHGRPNLHFDSRIAAAAALYRAGKVHHLLVSGTITSSRMTNRPT